MYFIGLKIEQCIHSSYSGYQSLRPFNDFSPFFGGRQSNVSMTIVVFIFLSVSLRCSIVVRSGIIAQLL